MILKESVMTNRRRKANDVESWSNRQSEKGQQCRELVKPLRKKAGGVEVTGKPLRKAGGKISRLKYRQRKAGGQSDFRIGMSAAHRRFREIKTPAMHIPVKMRKAIRISRIKIPGDASAREASPIQQVTMIVTITMLMV